MVLHDSIFKARNAAEHTRPYQRNSEGSQGAERPCEVQGEDVVFLRTSELHDELSTAVVQHEVLHGLLFDAVFVELQHEVPRLFEPVTS